MTLTSFRQAAWGLAVLGLVLVFLCVSVKDTATHAAVAPPVVSPTPTKRRYNCGDDYKRDYITFRWTRQMRDDGWLGEVTYGDIVRKPIQVFNPRPTAESPTEWTFQAQDGSFLCQMSVTSFGSKGDEVSFFGCRNNNWPQLTCGTFGVTEP